VTWLSEWDCAEAPTLLNRKSPAAVPNQRRSKSLLPSIGARELSQLATTHLAIIGNH